MKILVSNKFSENSTLPSIINSIDYPGGFIVTGVDRQNKRFNYHYASNEIHFAFGINLWRGHVWGVKENGKRKMLKSVYN